jgi:glyoxylase-like metal-dependent hydrolase (beta-lactamase superfamily II)
MQEKAILKISLPTPFPVGDVNVFLLKGEKLTLVDVGPKTKEAWEALTTQLAMFGYTPDDIEQVVVTHHHPDHVGLLDWFHEDLEIIGHSYNRRWLYRTDAFMEEYAQFYRQLFVECGIPNKWLSHFEKMKRTLDYSCQRPLTSIVKEGESVPFLPGWTVLETPGHAQSQIGLFHEEKRWLIGGDHVLATISSNPLLEPPEVSRLPRPKPQLQYNESLQKLLQYPIDVVYSGHGPNVTQVHALIKRRLERQHERAMQVKKLLLERPMTAFDVCQQLFPAVYEKQLTLTISETVGQLDYLVHNGEIQAHRNDEGVFVYEVVR